MPKSRRDRTLALTKVKKHSRAVKDRLVNSIRDCCSTFSSIYIFELQNPRNRRMKEIRDEWAGSRFFLGKNRVMQNALGLDEANETVAGSATLGRFLIGQRGLFFTNTEQEEVNNFFAAFADLHYARAGCVAENSFSLTAGPLPADICPHPIEPQLRKLGLPTKLHSGVIQLLDDVQVCNVGDVLTPEQGRILQIFQQPMATFRISLIARLEDGKVEEMSEGFGNSSEMLDDEAEDSGEEFIPNQPKVWGEIPVPKIK